MSATPEAPFSPLVADIITAQFALTANTTNALIESLEAQLAEVRAREAAVQDRILDLVSGPWMPNPNAIKVALFPSAEVVNQYRKGEE